MHNIVIACTRCSTADPVYDVPEDIELKEKGSTLRSGPQSNDTSRRHVYKEEVEIRYEKPVLASSGGTATNKKQKEEKPMMLIATPPSLHRQQSSEKIYQPLILPRPTKNKKSQPTKTWPLRQETLGQTWLIIQRDSTSQSGRMMRTISTSPCRLEGVGHLRRRGRTSH